MMSVFFLACSLIAYIWSPLAVEYLRYVDWNGAWWEYIDWLLIGNFLAMTLLIMAKADLRTDARLVLIGMFGGLAIEGWGTQTNLWFYFTAERPPLWIIPAWPIASLSIDRLVRLLSAVSGRFPALDRRWLSRLVYGLIFGAFYALMLGFVAPTLGKSLTILSLILCALLILTPPDHKHMLFHFLAGSGLGYFLELWGTTRQCWTYYTYQTPPLFAVLAHGMAAVAFWRAGLVLDQLLRRWQARYPT
jgi:hypothetical protein